jgi:integrase
MPKLDDSWRTKKIALGVTADGNPRSERVFCDTAIKGFGLRIKASGERAWIFQYKLVTGQPRRITLGSTQELTAKQARDGWKGEDGEWRDGAAKLKADVRQGIDVATIRKDRRASVARTFRTVLDEYLAAKETKLRPRSFVEIKRHLEDDWSGLHTLQMDDIKKGRVGDELDKILKNSGAISANRARASLNAFFAWAIIKDKAQANPVIKTEKQHEPLRKRVLSDQELAAVWLASDPASQYGRIIRLLMLTGCRRDEIGALRWSEIDLKAKTIALPGERTTNKAAHVVPLCVTAMEILKSVERIEDRDHVFGIGEGGYSGWSKSKDKLDAAVKLKPEWTVHDIRRTVRTGLGGLGIAPWVAEAVLNHLPPKLVRTYAVTGHETETNLDKRLEAEKRTALEAWANHIAVAIAQAKGENVVALHKA